MNLLRASTASLLALFFAACSGSSDGTSGGSTADGGTTSDGGTSDAAPSGAHCSSSAQPAIVADPFNGLSPSLDGSDIYYVDPTLGADLGGIKTGLIQHIHTDGTGSETIFTPTRPVSAATVQGTDIFFFQLEADDGTGNSPTHLYRVPRTGGSATMVSTYDFGAINLEATIDLPTAEYRIGVFAVQGTDAFVDEVTAISRISLTDGTRTVIADGSTYQIFYPTLAGSNIVYTAVDSTASGNALYTVPTSATSASGVRVGTQTCGSTASAWAASWSGGWVCGRVFGLDAVDATGANKTSFYDTKPVDSSFNPSAVDGTTFYAFGDGTGDDADPVRPLLKMDTQTPNAGTTVLCLDGGAKWNARVSTTDLIWEQFESTGSSVRTLRRIAR